ncbi:MAG: hypothetical protein QOG43_1979 [Actinomycetota bacterium]|jgi:hypothetical protein|nr:hypothetical protein [Actinomycetota bacterium]
MSAPRSGLIAVVGLLTMTACAADQVPAPGPTVTSTTLETSTSTSTPCEVDDGTANALEPLLTDNLPPGYERAPDAAEDTGPTDLTLAAFFVGGPDERAVLSSHGYRRGYQRLWYPPDGGGNDLIVHLYEFCGADGAAAYLRHTRERLLSPLWDSVEVDTDLPEDVVTLFQEGDLGGESFVAVLRVDGRFYVEIGAYGGPPREALDTLVARAGGLSTAQVDKLP